jgi:hypothetical protein
VSAAADPAGKAVVHEKHERTRKSSEVFGIVKRVSTQIHAINHLIYFVTFVLFVDKSGFYVDSHYWSALKWVVCYCSPLSWWLSIC